MTTLNIQQASEDEARAFFEAQRWPDGPVCPHCQSKNVLRLQGKSTRPGLLHCRDCRQQFTVKVGTIFEDSHIGLAIWLKAMGLICSSKKGISAHQLHRMMGVTYRTAWFMAHRIRFAMQQTGVKRKLKGVVEADETYVGGRPRYTSRKHGRRPLKMSGHTPVFAMVERDGEVRSGPVARVTANTLKGAIRDNVHKSSTIMTDEFKSYRGIGNDFDGYHHFVKHVDKEYVRGNVHINTAESYFALLKRGIHGTFHHLSKKHLHRYCSEFDFRWTTRKTDDASRVKALAGLVQGKRLLYARV